MLSNRETRFFVLYCLGFTFGIQYVYVNKNVTIEEAWTTCHNVYNGSLADIKSIMTSHRIDHEDANKISDNYWHGVFEKTTNWITFEDCHVDYHVPWPNSIYLQYEEGQVTLQRCDRQVTVGCYDENELDIKRNSNLTSIVQCQTECGHEPDTYFSVGEKICLCNDTTWNLTLAMNRSICDTDCGVSGLCEGDSAQVNIYRNVEVTLTKSDNDNELCLGFKCHLHDPMEFIALDCNAKSPYICGKSVNDEHYKWKVFANFINECWNIAENKDLMSSSICQSLNYNTNHNRWTPVFRKKWHYEDIENATLDELRNTVRITDSDKNRTKPFLCKTDTVEMNITGSTLVILASPIDTQTSVNTSPDSISFSTEPESSRAWTTPITDWSDRKRKESKRLNLVYGLSAGIVVLSALLIIFLVVYIKRQMSRSRRTKKKGAIENHSKTFVDVGVECSMEEFVNRNWFSDMKNKVERASLWEDKTKSRLSCSCNSEADDNTVALTNRFQSRSHTVHMENGFRMDMSSRSESVLRASTLSTIIDNHAFEYSEIDDPILLRYKTLASVHAEDDASDKAQADVTESDSTYFTLAMVAALTDKSRDQSIEVETGQMTSSTALNTRFDQNLETETTVLTTNDMHASELAIIQHQNENQNLESVGNENDAVYFVLEKQVD